MLNPKTLFARCLYLLLPLGLAYSPALLADLKQTLDWVPLSQLTQEQREQLPPGSCGAYISPLAGVDTNAGDIKQAPTNASSLKSEVINNNGSQQITLIGDVIITQSYRQLTADSAIYDEKTETVTIDGTLTVREPDLLLLADKGSINQQQNTLVIDNATYVIHSANARGHAEQLRKDSDNIIELRSSTYTQCEPSSNAWALKGSRITINTETRQGVATNVRLVVKGIPVFYWPYLRFPVGDERMSGFLYPSIAANDGTFDISVPYYFNLAPNYDLTFTPHFLGNHGTLFEVNGRHLHRYFKTDITVSHLGNDKGKLSDSEQALVNNGTSTTAEVVPFRGQDRWMVNIGQKGGKNQRWSTLIDYNEVSDNDYINDFDTSNLNTNSETSLRQQIKASYRFDHWNLTINNQQFQTLRDNITKPYKQLPQITFDGEYHLQDWDFELSNEWIRFDHSDADNPGDTTLVGDRARLSYSVTWNKEGDAGFFRPKIQAKHLSYQLNETKLAPGANSSPSITVPQAVIDTGLFFERDGGSYLQTFEPRLFYFYSDHKDQSDLTGTGRNIAFDTSELSFSYSQLFRDTRFSGGDRIDDANQLSVGLTTRFISNHSGRELFAASAGKIFYFDERQVTLGGTIDRDNNSAIATRLSANFNEFWRLTNDMVYDDDNNLIEDADLSLKHRGDSGSLFNLSYRFLRRAVSANTIKQVESSFILPFANKQWYFIGHANYDITNSRDLEQLLGFEYNSCCYRARFAFKRFLDDDQANVNNTQLTYDQGVILEFQFRGLGGTGKQFDKLFDENIDGYEQWQATHQ